MNNNSGKDRKIAVLIPCFNEALTIGKVVKDYKAALPEADIYVYDNNSTDGTADIARKSGAIVRHEYRQGKGNVIRSMFREIEAACYLIVDGVIHILQKVPGRCANLSFRARPIWLSATGCRQRILPRIKGDSIISAMSSSGSL